MRSGVLLLSIFAFSPIGHANPPPLPYVKDACWCRPDPALREPGRYGVFHDRVLFAREFKTFPFILDPACPDNKVVGLRIDNGPPTPCDQEARSCPVPAVKEGFHMFVVRCEGKLNGAEYFLGEGEMVTLDRTAPRILPDGLFGDGQILRDGIVDLSGRLDDGAGVGPARLIAEFRFEDPWRAGVSTSSTIVVKPEKRDGWYQWHLRGDFSRLGPRRGKVKLIAEDALGNRSESDDKASPAVERRFMLGIVPSRIQLTVPEPNGMIGRFAGISGTAVDAMGLSEVLLTVTEKAGWRLVGESVAPMDPRPAPFVLKVHGRSAGFHFDGLSEGQFRQGMKYVIRVWTKNRLGIESPTTEFEFLYSDPNLAIIADGKESEDRTLQAIYAVARSSACSSAVRILTHALYKRGEKIGGAAAYGLTRLGRPGLQSLLYHLTTSETTHVRYVAEALSRLSPEAQSEALPTIVGYAHDMRVQVRRAGVLALGSFASERQGAIPPAVAALRDGDANVRMLAAHSLCQLRGGRDAEVAGAVPGLVAMLANDDDDARYWAMSAMTGMGPAARDQLVPLLGASSTSTVALAAIAMVEISSDSFPGVASAITPALSDEHGMVRHAALEALKRLGPSVRRAAPSILKMFSDPDPFVRGAASEAILSVDPDSPETRESLKRALGDRSSRAAAAWALGRRGASSAWAIPDLVDAVAPEGGCGVQLNAPGEALAAIGVAAVPALIEMVRSGGDCARSVAINALAVIGPPAADAAPLLRDRMSSSNPETVRAISEALAKIAPTWDPKPVHVRTIGRDNAAVRSEVVPASIDKDIVPFLVARLRSPDSEKADGALVDLAYLGEKAVGALPELTKIESETLGDRRSMLTEAILRIRGGKPKPPTRLPISDRSVAFVPPEYPVTSDLSLKSLPQKTPIRVGEPAPLALALETRVSGVYVEPGGRSPRVLSAERLDPKGGWRAIDVPVWNLYRGGWGGSWLSSGPRELKAGEPVDETIDLNPMFVLDRPGRYRFRVDVVVARSSATTFGGMAAARASVRSRSVAKEILISPRDPAGAGRRFMSLNTEIMAFKDWNSGTNEEWDMARLIDYDAIPAFLHVVEVAANSSRAGTAMSAFAYLCDKRRVRNAVLADIEAHHRPHSEEEAKHLSWILAGAEAIPCRPKRSDSDEDYVRWDYSRARWEEVLTAKLDKR